jgi:hypothetical protein
MRVVIVDRRGAVRGSTVATTALVLFEIDTHWSISPATWGGQEPSAPGRDRRGPLSIWRTESRPPGSHAHGKWREALFLLGDRTEIRRPCQGSRGATAHRVAFAAHRSRHVAAPLWHRSSAGDPLARLRRNRSGASCRKPDRSRPAAWREAFAPVEITSVPMSPRGVLARTKTGLGIAASSLIYAAGYEVTRRVRAVVTASSRPGRSRRSANRIDFGRRGASYGKPDGPPLHPHNAGWPRHRRRRGRHQRRAETRRPDRDEDGRSQRLRSIEG